MYKLKSEDDDYQRMLDEQYERSLKQDILIEAETIDIYRKIQEGKIDYDLIDYILSNGSTDDFFEDVLKMVAENRHDEKKIGRLILDKVESGILRLSEARSEKALDSM